MLAEEPENAVTPLLKKLAAGREEKIAWMQSNSQDGTLAKWLREVQKATGKGKVKCKGKQQNEGSGEGSEVAEVWPEEDLPISYMSESTYCPYADDEACCSQRDAKRKRQGEVRRW